LIPDLVVAGAGGDAVMVRAWREKGLVFVNADILMGKMGYKLGALDWMESLVKQLFCLCLCNQTANILFVFSVDYLFYLAHCFVY